MSGAGLSGGNPGEHNMTRLAALGCGPSLGPSFSGAPRRLQATGALAGALLAVGLLVGLALALVAGRALRSLLVGVGPYDPAALTLSAAVMFAVAAVAAWLPARRALRIDPTEQLRAD